MITNRCHKTKWAPRLKMITTCRPTPVKSISIRSEISKCRRLWIDPLLVVVTPVKAFAVVKQISSKWTMAVVHLTVKIADQPCPMSIANWCNPNQPTKARWLIIINSSLTQKAQRLVCQLLYFQVLAVVLTSAVLPQARSSVSKICLETSNAELLYLKLATSRKWCTEWAVERRKVGSPTSSVNKATTKNRSLTRWF